MASSHSAVGVMTPTITVVILTKTGKAASCKLFMLKRIQQAVESCKWSILDLGPARQSQQLSDQAI